MTLSLTRSVTNLGANTFTTGIGTLNQPTSGSVRLSEFRAGPLVVSTLTLTAARIPVTDAGVSGSYGTLLLYTLPAGAISHLGCRQNYTAFAEGAALTTGAGDASFKIGIGTVAIAAAGDATFNGSTHQNIGEEISITLSGGTGTGTLVNGAYDGQSFGVFDGTSTAIKMNLNWSGSATTIDANSTIDVTGTITFAWLNCGDD